MSIKNAQQVDELTAKQLTNTIDAKLAKKGLTKTDSDKADLCIGYQTAIGSEKQLNAYNTGWATVRDGEEEWRWRRHLLSTPASSISTCMTQPANVSLPRGCR